MFNKIIWATDGSNAADLALPQAETLAKESRANRKTHRHRARE